MRDGQKREKEDVEGISNQSDAVAVEKKEQRGCGVVGKIQPIRCNGRKRDKRKTRRDDFANQMRDGREIRCRAAGPANQIACPRKVGAAYRITLTITHALLKRIFSRFLFRKKRGAPVSPPKKKSRYPTAHFRDAGRSILKSSKIQR